MSLFREMTAVGQAATAPFEEEDVRNMRTNKTFRAKIVPLADIEINASLGRDPRAEVSFRISDRCQISEINTNDIVQALGYKFKILPTVCPDNPANLHLEYHAQKIEACDQQ